MASPYLGTQTNLLAALNVSPNSNERQSLHAALAQVQPVDPGQLTPVNPRDVDGDGHDDTTGRFVKP